MEAKPSGALHPGAARGRAELAAIPSRALVEELAARMERERVFTEDSALVSVGVRLATALREQLDLHHNRFSRTRYRDLFASLYLNAAVRPPIDGATVVDLGCGGVNPGAMAFLFLALGARRGVAIDLDDIADPRVAVRSLADVASMLVIDAKDVAGPAAPPPQQILANLASFDLAKLARGDAAGLDGERIGFLQESAYRTSLATGEADFVFSVSFLEHVDDPAAAARELARITKPGGVNSHVIDLLDHRSYWKACDPLEFLREGGTGSRDGCNRLRRSEFEALFRAHGFVVLECRTLVATKVDAARRASFAEPWRSMSQEDLDATLIRMVVRREP